MFCGHTAAPARDDAAVSDLYYGPHGPTETEERVLGDLSGRRLVEIGGVDAALYAVRSGATATAVLETPAAFGFAQQRVGEAGVHVDLQESDLAELAFVRGDSVDVVVSIGTLAQINDLDRVFRQAHRVLRTNAMLVLADEHPWARSVRLERAYADEGPPATPTFDTEIAYPRTLGTVLLGLNRAGFRVDRLIEHGATPSGAPATIVWRARKEGS